MKTINECIKKMTELSKTPYHEVINDCLDYYGVLGVRDLTVEQANNYLKIIKGEGL